MMSRSILFIVLFAVACRKVSHEEKPRDTSATEHERQAGLHADAAVETAQEPRTFESHRRAAAEHRAASAALRDAEQSACTGLAREDIDISPLARTDDIARVEPLIEERPGPRHRYAVTVGATITFRSRTGLTAERLQHLLACQQARFAALGYARPELAGDPLALPDVSAKTRLVAGGIAVDLRTGDEETAHEILRRAERLQPGS